jgi:membrane dipeptidase
MHIPPPLNRRRFLRATAGLAALRGLNIHVRAETDNARWRTGNEVIDRAREVALGILKPTVAQTQRAIELHKSALVFDSYGFAPRAAIDGQRFNEVVQAGAGAAELGDLREEMMMTRMATDERERKEFLDAFHTAGVTCICASSKTRARKGTIPSGS